MKTEKIIEIARRFDPDEPDFVMTEDTLIAFAQSVIEEERGSSGIGKKLSAYKTLVESLEARMANLEKNRLRYQEAMDTLESERKCNAKLTEELAERDSNDKPVAFMHEDGKSALVAPDKLPTRLGSRMYSIPLYRRPPPARKLTDDEIEDVLSKHISAYGIDANPYSFARAIERRINGEKE